MPDTPELERLLRGAHLRVTRPRVAVLEAVLARPHSDTDTVLRDVRAELGQVSHQAVYDVLRALTTAGLVRRIQPLGHVARYEARVADNHHHAVCRGCGTIADVGCSVGEAPCLTPLPLGPTTPVGQGLDPGFVVDEAEVIYWGLCPACAAQRPRRPAPQTDLTSDLPPDLPPDTPLDSPRDAQHDPSLERTTS